MTEGTPVTELQFTAREFELYRPEFQRNEEYNEQRLVIRRKLDALGKLAAKQLSEKGCELTARASLHHPYTFNGYRVATQFMYLSRGDAERRALKRILGVDLGKDLDQNFQHTLLVLEISQEGLEVALRVHKDAWWDGENLKRRLQSAAEREAFATLVRVLTGYAVRVGDHRRLHPCESMTAAELGEMMRYYTPGEQWFHLFHRFAKDHPFVTEPGFSESLVAELHALLPVYRFVRWSPESNQVFR